MKKTYLTKIFKYFKWTDHTQVDEFFFHSHVSQLSVEFVEIHLNSVRIFSSFCRAFSMYWTSMKFFRLINTSYVVKFDSHSFDEINILRATTISNKTFLFLFFSCQHRWCFLVRIGSSSTNDQWCWSRQKGIARETWRVMVSFPWLNFFWREVENERFSMSMVPLKKILFFSLLMSRIILFVWSFHSARFETKLSEWRRSLCRLRLQMLNIW